MHYFVGQTSLDGAQYSASLSFKGAAIVYALMLSAVIVADRRAYNLVSITRALKWQSKCGWWRDARHNCATYDHLTCLLECTASLGIMANAAHSNRVSSELHFTSTNPRVDDTAHQSHLCSREHGGVKCEEMELHSPSHCSNGLRRWGEP